MANRIAVSLFLCERAAMANFRIVTNNPAVLDRYPLLADYVSGSLRDVFTAARDRVHLGARLISHPLAGSVKPNETPYKSIVLSTAKGTLDTGSLSLMEDAIAVLERMPPKDRVYTDCMHRDYQAIDLDLIDSAMQVLPAEYHA